MAVRLPLVVLGGSDLHRSAVPPGLAANDMLTGYKGVRRFRWGRCLAGELIDRARASGCFQEPILVGPSRVYQKEIDCEIVDVEGNLVSTLQRAVETIRDRFDAHEPLAFISCDIVPSADELRRLISESYEPHQDCIFWGQLIQADPNEMGASSWKPSYRLLPDAGQLPMNFYPGHLIIVRPEGLRFSLTNHLLQLAYRYRNRQLHRRFTGLTLRAIGALIAADIQNLRSFQLPVLTVSLPLCGLWGYYKYRRNQLTLPEFEDIIAAAFLHRAYNHRGGERPVVFSVTSMLSFAKDIDTIAEFEEVNLGQPCVSV